MTYRDRTPSCLSTFGTFLREFSPPSSHDGRPSRIVLDSGGGLGAGHHLPDRGQVADGTAAAIVWPTQDPLSGAKAPLTPIASRQNRP